MTSSSQGYSQVMQEGGQDYHFRKEKMHVAVTNFTEIDKREGFSFHFFLWSLNFLHLPPSVVSNRRGRTCEAGVTVW